MPQRRRRLARPVLKDRLGRARGLLAGYLDQVHGRKSVDEATFEELEEALILADVGITTTNRILADLRAKVLRRVHLFGRPVGPPAGAAGRPRLDVRR